MSTPPRAVVTGGAGAVGSRLVRRLLAEGVEQVQVVDDLSSGHRWLLPDDPAVTLVEADVGDVADLGLDGRDAWVFHLAALFANQNSVDHPFDDLRTNGGGTLAALTWAERAGARRLVYASAGCSIAGHDVEGPIGEDLPVSLHLDTPYQITKALGELYCNYFEGRLSTVRCRFFNSYGPGEVPGAYRNVIPNFIWSALHDQPLLITGTGAETRDFVFVDDLVDGLVRAAAHPGASGGVFNLGTGVPTRVDELARMVIDLCGSASQVEHGPRRAWDRSTHRQADISRARRVLSFQPSVAVAAGLAATVEWFRQEHDQIKASLDGAP